MPFQNAEIINLALDPTANNVTLVRSQMKLVNEDKSWSAMSVKRKTGVGGFYTQTALGLPNAAARRQIGSSTAPVTTGIEFTKQFKPWEIAGVAVLYHEQVRDSAGGVLNLTKETQAMLPMSVDMAKQSEFASVLMNGIQGTVLPPGQVPYLDTLTGDGLSLFNTAHEYKSSDLTYSNMLDTDTLPSEQAFDDVNTLINGIQLANGRRAKINIKRVLCSFDLITANKVVLNSEFTPETNANAVNKALQIPNWDIMENPYFSEQFQVWFTDSPEETKMHFVVAEEPNVGDPFVWPDNRSISYYVNGSFRFQPAVEGGFNCVCNRAALPLQID